MMSFFCQSEGHRYEGKSIWEDTTLGEKRFQRTQICVVKCLGFGGIVILYDMDLLEDTYLSRGHGSEAVHGFESCICIPYINTAGAGMMLQT